LFSSCFYRTGLLNRPSVKQKFLGEGGFAGVGVGDDGEVAPLCHRCAKVARLQTL
jgi:hypothetical protein